MMIRTSSATTLVVVVSCSILLTSCNAFVGTNNLGQSTRKTYSLSPLYALTERQMQFWEDVESGLDDIENFYAKKGQSIDRIRQFGKRLVQMFS